MAHDTHGPDGPSYRALALQVRTVAVNRVGPERAGQLRAQAIARLAPAVQAANAFLGGDVRLVVLPEYVLTGHPLGEPVPVWAEKAAIAPNGPEYDALAEVASGAGVHLAGNAYETDPNFPGLYFQACFLIDPGGSVVLRYRRLHSMYSPSPYDVWDRYLDCYGLDGVLPVARTELGAIAALASEEILYPELARALALRGAEVFVQPTSEAGSPRQTIKDVARLARAVENCAYVVSANSAGLLDSPVPAQSTDGGSQVVSFDGLVLAEAGQGESMVANAVLDLAALRRARRRPGMGNLLARLKPQLWAQVYAAAEGECPGGLDGSAVPDRSFFRQRQQEVLDRLQRAGVIA